MFHVDLRSQFTVMWLHSHHTQHQNHMLNHVKSREVQTNRLNPDLCPHIIHLLIVLVDPSMCSLQILCRHTAQLYSSTAQCTVLYNHMTFGYSHIMQTLYSTMLLYSTFIIMLYDDTCVYLYCKTPQYFIRSFNTGIES